MAVYHGDSLRYLEPALRSVLVSEVDRVLVGIDGPLGSELAAELELVAASDSRIELVRFAQGRGLANVLNDLIDIALAQPECDLLFRMDADDVSEPWRFASQIAFLANNPEVDVLGGCADLVDAQDVVFGAFHKAPVDEVLKRRLPYDSPFVHPTVAMRAALLRQGHRYPTTTIRFEDVAFWAALALAGARFANLTTPILRYRATRDTIRRRTGWRKVLNETLVRLRYVIRASPLRVDVLLLVTLIAFAKSVMPVRALIWLQSLRARLNAPANSR
jgi:glycosyltransferase involved in cell wall biosynthesis